MSIPHFHRFDVRRLGLTVLGLAWVGVFAAGTHGALRWESTPGLSAPSVPSFAPAKEWRLLLVAHPDCPCSAASLRTLGDLLQTRGLSATALFVSAPRDSANVRLARSISGLRVEFEADPDPARDHGARTSGQTFLLDPAGRVRFSGGLTDGRGMDGPSMGQAAVEAILRGAAAPSQAPVYGCALFAAEGGR